MTTNQVKCRLCLDRKWSLLDHHVSYFPELTEVVCKRCHDIIHENWNEFKGSWIQYEYGDAGRFYNKYPTKRNALRWMKESLPKFYDKLIKKGNHIRCKNCTNILLKVNEKKREGLCYSCFQELIWKQLEKEDEEAMKEIDEIHAGKRKI